MLKCIAKSKIKIKINKGVYKWSAYSWMMKAKCEWAKFKQSYYTDVHNRPNVLVYRRMYIEEQECLALLQHLWVNQNYENDICIDQLNKSKLDLECKWFGSVGGGKHSQLNKLQKRLQQIAYSSTALMSVDAVLQFIMLDKTLHSTNHMHIQNLNGKLKVFIRTTRRVIGGGQCYMACEFICKELGFGFPFTDSEIKLSMHTCQDTTSQKFENAPQCQQVLPALSSSTATDPTMKDTGTLTHSNPTQIEELVCCFGTLHPDHQLLIELDPHLVNHGKWKDKMDLLSANLMLCMGESRASYIHQSCVLDALVQTPQY